MRYLIKHLTPDLLDDFLWFFDNRAFCDNPDWAGCYCMFYNCKASLDEWMKRTKPQNRVEAESHLKSGRLKGFMAYDNNTPIGFCNVNAKENLFFDKYRTEINRSGAQGIVSVVCFVIDPNYRRKGVSKALLRYAISVYDKAEYEFIESYPSINSAKETDNYHGYYNLYEQEDLKRTILNARLF